ncbi:MAG: HAD-IIB family hydrolase, partial [bacterium]|nr:HAD-IIB family hydrolase [bacterium]
FDLDNTLTPSKSHIEDAHIPILKQLADRNDVIVVSGHGEKDIKNHLTPTLEGFYYILGQNGNRAEMKDRSVLWNNSLSRDKKDAIFAFIKKARAYLNYKVKDENDIVEDRDSQIAFSLIGHHEDKKIKDAFDPDHAKRRKLLTDLADDVKKLEKAGVEIRTGGTTNLDIFELGKNKGYNVEKFIETMGWQKDECLYIGDALFPGGNDETVIGIIATHAVKDHNDTFEFIKNTLLA